MPATNPITNAPIQSKPFSSAYGNGWENIFLKKPQDWLDLLYPNLIVRSHDGFRWDDGVTWETPMRREEFEKRLSYCTVLGVAPFLKESTCIFEE